MSGLREGESRTHLGAQSVLGCLLCLPLRLPALFPADSPFCSALPNEASPLCAPNLFHAASPQGPVPFPHVALDPTSHMPLQLSAPALLLPRCAFHPATLLAPPPSLSSQLDG